MGQVDAELVYSGISPSDEAQLDSEVMDNMVLAEVFRATPTPVYCRNNGNIARFLCRVVWGS